MSNDKKSLPMVVEYLKQEKDSESTSKTEPNEDFDSGDIESTKHLRLLPVAIFLLKDVRCPLKQQAEKFLLKMYGIGSNIPVLGLFSGKDFLDLDSFMRKIAEFFTCTVLDISDKSFSKFKELLHLKVIRKNIYVCGGSQFGRFIYKNAEYIYDSGDVILAKKLDETKDYDCIENSLIDLSNSCRPELAKTKNAPKEVAVSFFSNLYECFSDSKTFMCFGAVLATAFWELFQQEIKGFPAIFFLGESHSGKSTLMLCLNSIFGLRDSSVMSGTSTPFAVTKELGGRLGIPLFIEEIAKLFFKNYAETLVKVVYAAIPRERGTKTGVEKLQTFTTFVACSNFTFIEPTEALLSRILFVHMKKDDFVREKFRYFTENSRNELSAILPLILRYRQHILPLYNKVLQFITQKIKDYSGDRYLRSVAISCTMWILVNKIVGYELYNWQKMAVEYCSEYESFLQSRVADSDLLLRHIAKLIVDEALVYGVHYQLVHETILRLNLKKFVEIFNIKIATNSETMLTPKLFCLQVSGDKRFDTQRTKMKTIGRSISINIANEENLLAVVRGFKIKQPYTGKYEDETEEN